MDFTALLGDKMNNLSGSFDWLKNYLNVDIDTGAIAKDAAISKLTGQKINVFKNIKVSLTDKGKTWILLIAGAIILYFVMKKR